MLEKLLSCCDVCIPRPAGARIVNLIHRHACGGGFLECFKARDVHAKKWNFLCGEFGPEKSFPTPPL
jgi:hypothetical protein